MHDIKPTVTACHAASRLGRTVNRALADSDLTPAGYRLLSNLTTGGQSAATTLADSLLVSRPTVTATIDWLEERAFVVRSPDPTDRRKVNISVTRKGELALADADDRVARRLGEVLSQLSSHQARTIVAALHLLHDALDADRQRRHTFLTQENE